MFNPLASPPGSGRGISRRSVSMAFVSLLALLGVAFGANAGVLADNSQDTYQVRLVSQLDTTEAPATDSATADSTTHASVADVAEAVNPAVVTIYTFTTQPQAQTGMSKPDRGHNGHDPYGDRQSASEPVALGAGSGWIYSEEGFVVTNAHVVAGADVFTVRFSDGTEAAAALVGTDVFQDVAVLRLDLARGQTVPAVATVGDSSAMRAGDEVVAIGSPLGEFTNSVSEGIIGGLDRSLDSGAGYRLGNLIQHDAEISSGNSGGPLVNMQGEVIGMNVAKIDSSMTTGASVSGLNFAIDGNTVASIVDEIIATNGDIAYPYLGIQSQWDGEQQVVVSVEPGTPAADAGVEGGDVIIAVDGEQVTGEMPLINLLFDHRPGDDITLTVERQGASVDLQVTLGERPSDSAA